METALVFGFGPFPGAPRNPSAELVRALGKRRRPALAGTRIVTAILPTNYAAVRGELPMLIKRHDPDAVLFFGLASRARFLRIERRAVNSVTGFYPDATGAKLATRAFMPGMPAELPVRADVARLAAAARSAGVNARLSRDAGRYICNAALYQTLLTARESTRPRIVTFVHIPRPHRRARLDGIPERPRPNMQSLVRAGEAILAALITGIRRG